MIRFLLLSFESCRILRNCNEFQYFTPVIYLIILKQCDNEDHCDSILFVLLYKFWKITAVKKVELFCCAFSFRQKQHIFELKLHSSKCA